MIHNQTGLRKPDKSNEEPDTTLHTDLEARWHAVKQTPAHPRQSQQKKKGLLQKEWVN
jgi:flagellar biosynthesis/type III secretory pathway chaperone